MSILLNLTLFTMLFPWLSFGLLNLDTQPWFIIMASLFYFVNYRKKIHISIFSSLLLVFSVISVGIAYGHFDFFLIRAILSYYSFFIVLSSYYIIKKYYVLPVWVLTFSNIIWLCAGVLQVVFGKYILSFLVHVRTTDDRGVTGLAPEPTFYGIFLFFLCWLLYLERENIPRKLYTILIYLNIIFILFIAKSSMVILFLLIAIFLYVIFNFFSIRRLIIVMLFSTLISLLTLNFGSYFEGTRVFKLASMVIDAPLFVVEKDASMNERASHIFFSFRAFFNDFGLPHGFHSFSSILESGRSEPGSIFWWGGASDKVMSGLGAIFFELGVGAILFLIPTFWLMLSKRHIKQSMYFLTLLLGLFMSAIPLSFTLLPMIIITTHFYFIKRGPCEA